MLSPNQFSSVSRIQPSVCFGMSKGSDAIQKESTFSEQHGPGNTTCFGVEPLPTAMDQYDYRLRHNAKPIVIKVWGDYRETDSIAIRLIQVKKIFEQNPKLKLNRANVHQALGWLTQYFPMIRQDIRPSVLADVKDQFGNIKKSNTIALCTWDTKQGFDALDTKPFIKMLLKPIKKNPNEYSGRNSEKFLIDPNLKASLGRSITSGIEAAPPEPPTLGVHIAKCIWHLLPKETKTSFSTLIDKEQLPGSQLVLGSNEQFLDMKLFLNQDKYTPATTLNKRINAQGLRQSLNQKDGLVEPQWIYTKDAHFNEGSRLSLLE